MSRIKLRAVEEGGDDVVEVGADEEVALPQELHQAHQEPDLAQPDQLRRRPEPFLRERQQADHRRRPPSRRTGARPGRPRNAPVCWPARWHSCPSRPPAPTGAGRASGGQRAPAARAATRCASSCSRVVPVTRPRVASTITTGCERNTRTWGVGSRPGSRAIRARATAISRAQPASTGRPASHRATPGTLPPGSGALRTPGVGPRRASPPGRGVRPDEPLTLEHLQERL